MWAKCSSLMLQTVIYIYIYTYIYIKEIKYIRQTQISFDVKPEGTCFAFYQSIIRLYQCMRNTNLQQPTQNDSVSRLRLVTFLIYEHQQIPGIL